MAEEQKTTAKYRSIIIDTVSQLQDDQYIAELSEANKKKLSYDEWKDHGVNILNLYRVIKTLPDTIPIQVLGYEGEL